MYSHNRWESKIQLILSRNLKSLNIVNWLVSDLWKGMHISGKKIHNFGRERGKYIPINSATNNKKKGRKKRLPVNLE